MSFEKLSFTDFHSFYILAFSAIYLKTAKVLELSLKIKAFCGLPSDCKCDFYVSGPSGTRVILTDEVN